MYAADVGRGRMGRVPVLADAGQKDHEEGEPSLEGYSAKRL